MRNLLNKFSKKEDGIAAIEFAILAPVFFALLTAIFEITMFVYSNTASQRAVEDAVYHMRTGNIYAELLESEETVETWLRREICDSLSISTCAGSLTVQVEKFDTNYDVYSNSSDPGGVIDAGASGILMRVETTVEVPNLVFTEAIFGSDNMTITSGLTFMTEPY